MKDQIVCRVLNNVEIAPGIHQIEIEKTVDFKDVKPGQFIHIKCGELLLRRPISISYITEGRLGCVIRDGGKGSHWICHRNPGDTLDLLGPLGNGFTINQEKEKVVVIGGGIGVAPLVELVKQLKDKDITVLLGYRNEPYLINEFEKYATSIKVATEDGCSGHHGFVTDLLVEEIAKGIDRVYGCGPEIMLKKVQGICGENRVPSELSIEERMACGVGACLVCACKVKSEKAGFSFVKTCKDGPVFSGDEVIFDE